VIYDTYTYRTAELENTSKNFFDAVKKLKEREANKKWYEF
jgi:hypothetical protein